MQRFPPDLARVLEMALSPLRNESYLSRCRRSQAARFVVQPIAMACLAGAIAAVVGTGAWRLHAWDAWLASAAATLAAAHGRSH